MADREMNSIGRILALVLRHAPEKFNVDMDLNGWVNAKDLSFSIQEKRRGFHWLRPWHLNAIADTDEKGRYQMEGDMIRATYGHSIELELDLPTDNIPDELYWPCDPETVSTHLEYGIISGNESIFTCPKPSPTQWKQDMSIITDQQLSRLILPEPLLKEPPFGEQERPYSYVKRCLLLSFTGLKKTIRLFRKLFPDGKKSSQISKKLFLDMST